MEIKQTVPSSQNLSKREWSPHIWQGCDFFAWARLLVRNPFAVHLRYGYIAVIVTIVSLFHTLLRFIQDVWFWRDLRRATIPESPIFIVGHWRTGTTLLHELLILDQRHGFPNTYECLEPNHFLLTEWIATRLLWFLTPSHRPMDNMATGWDRPQEDEFALCMMGQPSPYLTIAFPNRPPQDLEAYDLRKLSARQRASWKKAFQGFLKRLTLKDPRRLILKSPTHSFRIRTLLELFPDARFVHIVRDPHVVFPSTVHLWKSLYKRHGFQDPTFAGLEERVYDTFNLLYQRLEEDRFLVRPSHFYELHYEDLIESPLEEMRRLYDHFQLGEFERVRHRLKQYLEQNAGYQTNRYTLTEEQRAEVDRRWGEVILRYGYAQGKKEKNSLKVPSSDLIQAGGVTSLPGTHAYPQRITGS